MLAGQAGPQESACARLGTCESSEGAQFSALECNRLPVYKKLWAGEEEKKRQLLLLLYKARSELLEPFFDIFSQHQLEKAIAHEICTPGSIGLPQTSEEPSVCHRDPYGGTSSLRVFSGTAYLSHKHVAALSHTASGV